MVCTGSLSPNIRCLVTAKKGAAGVVAVPWMIGKNSREEVQCNAGGKKQLGEGLLGT
jgi:hypothetical protein